MNLYIALTHHCDVLEFIPTRQGNEDLISLYMSILYKDNRLFIAFCFEKPRKCSRYMNSALNSPVAVEAHAKSTAIARYFASRFNGRLHGQGERLASLLFVPCFLYEVEGDSTDEPKCFAAERYLPGVFLKYNSNSGYVADSLLPHNDMVQAFLHFSFEESGGKFIVADLQGVARDNEVLLTDPQVLSLTRDYGPGDLGVTGYLRCLRAHRCGRTCQHLGLTPISSSRMKRIESSTGSHASGSSWQHVHSVNSFGDWERLSEHAAAVYTMSEGGLVEQNLHLESFTVCILIYVNIHIFCFIPLIYYSSVTCECNFENDHKVSFDGQNFM